MATTPMTPTPTDDRRSVKASAFWLGGQGSTEAFSGGVLEKNVVTTWWFGGPGVG